MPLSADKQNDAYKKMAVQVKALARAVAPQRRRRKGGTAPISSRRRRREAEEREPRIVAEEEEREGETRIVPFDPNARTMTTIPPNVELAVPPAMALTAPVIGNPWQGGPIVPSGQLVIREGVQRRRGEETMQQAFERAFRGLTPAQQEEFRRIYREQMARTERRAEQLETDEERRRVPPLLDTQDDEDLDDPPDPEDDEDLDDPPDPEDDDDDDVTMSEPDEGPFLDTLIPSSNIPAHEHAGNQRAGESFAPIQTGPMADENFYERAQADLTRNRVDAMLRQSEFAAAHLRSLQERLGAEATPESTQAALVEATRDAQATRTDDPITPMQTDPALRLDGLDPTAEQLIDAQRRAREAEYKRLQEENTNQSETLPPVDDFDKEASAHRRRQRAHDTLDDFLADPNAGDASMAEADFNIQDTIADATRDSQIPQDAALQTDLFLPEQSAFLDQLAARDEVRDRFSRRALGEALQAAAANAARLEEIQQKINDDAAYARRHGENVRNQALAAEAQARVVAERQAADSLRLREGLEVYQRDISRFLQDQGLALQEAMRIQAAQNAGQIQASVLALADRQADMLTRQLRAEANNLALTKNTARVRIEQQIQRSDLSAETAKQIRGQLDLILLRQRQSQPMEPVFGNAMYGTQDVPSAVWPNERPRRGRIAVAEAMSPYPEMRAQVAPEQSEKEFQQRIIDWSQVQQNQNLIPMPMART